MVDCLYLGHNSVFTLATSELCQAMFKADISRITETCQVSVILILAFRNGAKSVWLSFEVPSVNTLYYCHTQLLHIITTH